MLDVPPSSRASSAPTLILVGREFYIHRHSPVGASLLAIAVGQLAAMVNVPSSSRASSAPTLILIGREFYIHRHSPVGASLLAIAVGQLAAMVNVPSASRAGSLPHWVSGAIEPVSFQDHFGALRDRT